MENQELNLWLLKRAQTECDLKSEERKLDEVKKQYSKEKIKYTSARENFNSTKLKLLQKETGSLNPQSRHKQVVFTGKKLSGEKIKLTEICQRMAGIEVKLKKQSVLVLQNKHKLESLESKIGVIISKKIAKRNLRDELEVIDGKIQQIVQANKEVQSCDSPLQNNFTEGQAGNHDDRQDQHVISDAYDNTDYYRKITELEYLLERGNESVNLQYVNKNGGIFNLQIRRGVDKGLMIEIVSLEKSDLELLRSSKAEIVRGLKEQGFIVNSVTIKGRNGPE